jgi:hypothetical protein
MEPAEQGWKAPYVTYTTLCTLTDRLGNGAVPPRIDRGFLDTLSGSTQAMLLSTLKVMGLIGDAGEVLPALREAAAGPDARKAVFRGWAEDFYAEQLELAKQNATAQMLHETFMRHKYTGSTLRKAVVFFLSLCEDVGLPTSPHFKPPRQTAPTPRKRKRAPGTTLQPESAAPPEFSEQPARGEQKTVSFGDAGSVSISVNVRWLDLPEPVFRGLRDIVKNLEDLERLVRADGQNTAPDDAL